MSNQVAIMSGASISAEALSAEEKVARSPAARFSLYTNDNHYVLCLICIFTIPNLNNER